MKEANEMKLVMIFKLGSRMGMGGAGLERDEMRLLKRWLSMTFWMLLLLLMVTGLGCQSHQNQVPAEYLRWGYLEDANLDVIVTLDKKFPDRANPVFVMWYKGLKIMNLMDSQSPT